MDIGNTNSRGNTSFLVPVVILVAVLLVIGGYAIAQWETSLFADEASAEAQQVDELLRIMLFIGGGLFLLVQGLLIFSVIRFRHKEGDESDGPTIHGNVTLELVWTLIPSLVVLGLVIYSYQVWVDVREPKNNEMVVNVTGARFAWTFTYEDERVEQPIVSNDLHVYADRPVKLVMNTEDVIHSFWVPEMRIKQDLLPGRTTEIRFTPVKVDGKESDEYPLEYRVVCAELCGSGHGNMYTAIVIHETEEDYLASFADPAVDRILNPPDDPVLRGGQILASGAYPCSGCHTLNESGDGFTIDWAGVTGPSLEGVGERAPRRVSGQTAEEYLYTTIYMPNAYLVPGFGNLMNNFQSSDPDAANYMPPEDAHAIVAYLCSLTPDGESACDLDNLESFAATFQDDN